MNEITAITPQVKDKRRCNIFVDGRFYCGLTLECTIKNRLKVGQIVTEEYLSKIQLESEKETALDKALLHISATRKTEREMRSFLREKGYLPSVIAYVMGKMKEYHFVDDREYAENYVHFSSRKKGAKRIQMELRQKGVSDDKIEEAIGGLEEGVQLETAKTVLQKYMRGKTPDRETLAKAFRYLLGKGFDVDTAKSALSAFGDVDEE